MEYQKIMIDTSAIILTFRCNLKCKLCCTSSPYQKNPQLFPLSELNTWVKKYFDTVDFIRKLSMSGGEPLLHTDLPEFIEETMKYKNQFDIFEIITNGTIVPSEELLAVLEKYSDIVFVMIDHYGNVSRKVEEIDKILEQRGISHTIRKYYGEDAHFGGWVDLGDFSHKNTPAKAQELFNSCVISNTPKRRTGRYKPVEEDEFILSIPYMAMTQGVLHHCARSYATMLAGSIPLDSQSFVNLMDLSKTRTQLRNEIDSFMKIPYVSACEYCNGFSSDSKRYPPAEQLL